MLDFRKLQLSDRETVTTLCYTAGFHSCQYAFPCMMMWGSTQIAYEDGFLILKGTYDGMPFYLFPIGDGDLHSIFRKMKQDSEDRNVPFRMIGLETPKKEWLESLFPGKFFYSTNRDNYDYLYDIESLATLSGKKLQSKRNHINRFKEAYPDYSWEPITEENLPECREMTLRWFSTHTTEDTPTGFYDDEIFAINIGLHDFTELGIDGILLRADSEVVAFTMGSRMSKTLFDVSFEKAYSDIQGAYSIINQLFSQYIHEKYPEVSYLNREDDMGVEGLRKAKLSYHPAILLEKHMACLKEEACDCSGG